MNVTPQGVSYEYEVVGSGEPLLLLHGFTGSMETWRSFIFSWSEQFQVIVVDLVGHGKTESPENVAHYDIRNVALQMKELLDYLHIEKHIYLATNGRKTGDYDGMSISRLCTLSLLENCTAGLETKQIEKNVVKR